jgi:hypothetical protein
MAFVKKTESKSIQPHPDMQKSFIGRTGELLFFDTFERLTAEATPWLLDYFLEADISANVVLVVAGRDPIERSTPVDPKSWLPYLDDNTIYQIYLNSFTEDETRKYLVARNITDPDRISTV